MDDKELYRQILGICPKCDSICNIHDRRNERIGRFLDTCQLKIFIPCQIPRVKCPDHKTKTMNITWAEEMSRFTLQFERIAIQFLEGIENRSKTAEALRISWDEMNNIMNKAVSRGLSRRDQVIIKHIGIDEKSFLKGHNYISVMTDTDGKRILGVVKDRKKESVDKLWGYLTEKQKDMEAGEHGFLESLCLWSTKTCTKRSNSTR